MKFVTKFDVALRKWIMGYYVGPSTFKIVQVLN